jgi:hypothetical protein
LKRRRAIALSILAAGLLAAVAIYVNATSAAANPLGYDPEDTKRYLREIEVYGGTANVLASQLREWFVSLWRGERLAYTVAVLTLVSSWAYWFFSRPAPEDA